MATSTAGGSGGGGSRNKENSLLNQELELLDPNPNIFALFSQYNEQFFEGRLGVVTVEWSKRMTSCAGLCYYQGRSGGCRIKLSEPLLSLRPRSDLVNTLIHEMIHAYIFIVNGGHTMDRDGHGADFQELMHKINGAAGTSISVYHTFNNEVDHHHKHWWRCDGPCQNRYPFFGYVKRAMNRAPAPTDRWWSDHKAGCSGTFIKVKEPEPKVKAKKEKGGGGKKRKAPTVNPIEGYFKKVGETGEGAKKAKRVEEVIVLSDGEEDEDLKRALALSLEEAQQGHSSWSSFNGKSSFSLNNY